MIAVFVNRGLAGKKIPDIGEIYPEFRDDSDKMALRRYKEQFKQFAEMHNKMRGSK